MTPELARPGATIAPVTDTIAPPDLSTLPLPARESHSSLSTYAACPRRYAFRYVERLPGEVPRWWFTFGSAVHARLRGVRPGLDPRPAGRHAGPRVRHPGAGLRRGGRGRRVRARGGRPVPRPQRARPPRLPRAGRHVGRRARRGGARLRRSTSRWPDDETPVRFVGYIDRIDRRPDGAIEVIDHKTGRPRSQDDVDRDRQLTAYAFACARGGLRDPATRRGPAGARAPRAPLRRDRGHGLDHAVGRGSRCLRRPPGRRGRGHPPARVRTAARERLPVVRVPRHLPGCRASGVVRDLVHPPLDPAARARLSHEGLATGDASGETLFRCRSQVRDMAEARTPAPGPWLWTDDTANGDLDRGGAGDTRSHRPGRAGGAVRAALPGGGVARTGVTVEVAHDHAKVPAWATPSARRLAGDAKGDRMRSPIRHVMRQLPATPDAGSMGRRPLDAAQIGPKVPGREAGSPVPSNDMRQRP